VRNTRKKIDLYIFTHITYICNSIFFIMDVLQQIQEATLYIQSKTSIAPQVGVILGSGLGNFTSELEIIDSIDYADIPYFPVSTVEGHSGKLLFGNLHGKTVACMAGRFHYYEGYATQEVVFPVRVLKALGISTLLVSNAAGGVQPGMQVGDLMIINDHISFATVNPLLGKNIAELGPRFPDMSEPYSKVLISKVKTIAAAHHITLKEGVYFGVTGPTFETRAEYKLIHVLGGDAVGMSTVQEVIAARHADIPVFAMSVITDIGIRKEENTITHEEVLEAANAAGPKFTLLFTELIKAL
jgi:purine-nucleoside phosphorylase